MLYEYNIIKQQFFKQFWFYILLHNVPAITFAASITNMLSSTLITPVAVTSQSTTKITPTTLPNFVELNQSNFRGNTIHHSFSTLDKEVVNKIIKQWAPIVWLAPEEKFMPLAVEEFLNNVKPMDRENTLLTGIPIGDNSKGTYLVTKDDVETLLENKNSFIYGRNPNENKVPVYAVVTLCSKQSSDLNLSNNIVDLPQLNKKTTLTGSIKQQSYIPVTVDLLKKKNNTLKQKTHLHPKLTRMKRSISWKSTKLRYPLQILPYIIHPDLEYNLTLQQQNGKINGENYINKNFSTSPIIEQNNMQIKNFMANLADNVKFSAFDDSEIENKNKSSKISILNQKKKISSFHVTYWMFYPYSQGKTLCTINLGPLGRIPFPAVYGYCLGGHRDIGSHIGDWEHMSLYFNGDNEPEVLYVSAHDAGAYYIYNKLTGSFEFKKQETRKGLLQRPNFPKTVTTFHNHPVLFAAKGSHGLWTAPGKHRFVKVARLYDVNGFGTPWKTWKSVDITYENLNPHGRSFLPSWLHFKGKWGNPKNKCHPFRRIGLNFCEYADGPTGIPLKEPHFQCATNYH